MVQYKAAVSTQAFDSSHKYFIVPPEGGDPVEYRSVSNFIEAGNVPADSKNLVEREKRYAVAGILANPKFLAEASTFDPDGDWDNNKQPFNKLLSKAARAAGVWDSAEWGTGLHAWGEDIDNGQVPRDPLADKPDLDLLGPAVVGLSTSWRDKGAFKILVDNFAEMRKDVQAYIDLSEAHGMIFSHVEATVVLDEYGVAGTLDRLGNVATWSPAYCCEKPHTFDIKSGSMDYGKRTKVMQFGAYSFGKLYNHNTLERTESGACTETAYAIHIPARNPAGANLVPVPLERARYRLDLAHEIWQEHSKQHRWKKYGLGEWIDGKIDSVSTEDEMDEFYARTQQYWSTEHVTKATTKVETLRKN